jgi:hypothetical protein
MGEKGNAYVVYVPKSEGKTHCKRTGHGKGYNIKIDLK